MTDRQARFVEAYPSRGPTFGNATRAAESAGYRWPNKLGPRLRTYPEVAAAVEQGFERILAEARREHASR